MVAIPMVDLPRPVLILLFSACGVGCPYVDDSDLASRLNADIDGDGVVNVTEILFIVGNWGPCS